MAGKFRTNPSYVTSHRDCFSSFSACHATHLNEKYKYFQRQLHTQLRKYYNVFKSFCNHIISCTHSTSIAHEVHDVIEFFFKFSYLLINIHCLILCWERGHEPQWSCGGQKTTFRSKFFPYTIWFMDMDLRSFGLGGNAFIH